MDRLPPLTRSITVEEQSRFERRKRNENSGDSKLGTFSGVFVTTTNNIISILMFLRYGFVMGQAGVFGTLLMLLLSYIINLFTTLSLCAVATNGTVSILFWELGAFFTSSVS